MESARTALSYSNYMYESIAGSHDEIRMKVTQSFRAMSAGISPPSTMASLTAFLSSRYFTVSRAYGVDALPDVVPVC